MKYKGTILFWIDMGLLTAFLLLASTGAIMHWALPPGSGGRFGGHASRKELLDLSRHDWGDIHFYIAAAMITLVIVHLALHWGWIKSSILRHLRFTRHAARYTQRS